MGRLMVFWVIIFLALTLIGIFGLKEIIKRRENKRLKKAEEEQRREEARRESDGVPEPQVEEDSYVAHFGISKGAEEYLQLIQFKTQTASVGEVVRDAIRFYGDIVNQFEPGSLLLLKKPAEEGYTLLKFKPLERIQKKVES